MCVCVFLPELQVVERDFVDLRKANRDISENVLHYWISFARCAQFSNHLLAFFHGLCAG